MALLDIVPLQNVLRGNAEAVQGGNGTLIGPERIVLAGTKPRFTVGAGKPLLRQERECVEERRDIHMSLSLGQGREKAEATCISGEERTEIHMSLSPTGRCLSTRFESPDMQCELSIGTPKDESGLFYPSEPRGGNAKDCVWEKLSIEQALEQMSEVHRADDYVEKCIDLLQKCKRRGSLVIAAQVYAHICENGLESHGILGSYIVAMFVHCSSLLMAQQAFDRLSHHNEFAWTHLVKGYIEGGDPEHGLFLFSRMKEDGIRPNKFAFVAVLRACSTLKRINIGQQLHTEIIGALDEDLYVSRALVDFYVKCGLFAEASDIFSDFHTIANSLVGNPCNSQCLDQGARKYSVETPVDPVDSKQVPSDAVTYVFSLKACSSMKALAVGRELHLQVVKEGHEQDCFVSNTLVDMYAKCGHISEAWKVHTAMPERDVVSWTALITGCVEHGLYEDALKYSEVMETEGVQGNAFTLVVLLKACGLMQALDSGRKLQSEIMKKGLFNDFTICNSLVDMYAKCGSIEEARMVFDKLSRRDIISWTSLIAGYTDHSSFKEAISCFEQMQMSGVSPNTVTYMCCLKSCAFLADLDMGHKLHYNIVMEELETHVFVGNALLRMYARCGAFLEAQALFEDLPNRDVVSWSILIAELAEGGHGERALKVLEQMRNEGSSSPCSFTYVCSLKACASIGAIEKGRKLHIDIVKKGLERIPFVCRALIGMYAECGKPINIDLS